MSELKPCPFCGSSNIDATEWTNSQGEAGPGCSDCGATGPSVAVWNRRHTPEGWQTVPKEPTQDMTWSGYKLTSSQDEAAAIYRLMLTEAPKPEDV